VEVEFLGQPFSKEGRLGRVLCEALADADSFFAIVAWAQVSGMGQVEKRIRALRGRGGSARAILGLDGGIATRESLELAVELFDPVSVFHDTGNRLFHPKIYCVERPDEILLAVGSSNLTGGGLFANYEANVVMRLQPAEAEDRRVYAAFESFRDALTADGMPVEPLTEGLIDRLAEEETLVAPREKREEAQTAARAKAEGLAREVFGPPVSGLPAAPREARSSTSKRRRAEATPPSGLSPSSAPPVLRWWKQMTASDVLRKPESSHQRNYVALSQAGHKGLDFITWFRHDLFGTITWSKETMRSGNVKEVALVPFEVIVEDESLGRHELRVDHAEARIANQRNSPTYLNWSAIIDVIRKFDFRGWWLELARLSDGTFRLRLLREEPVTA
jgi:HKD family nuclease